MDGRRRWMEGGGGWKPDVDRGGEADGTRRWMEGGGGWKAEADGRRTWMEVEEGG